MGWDSTLSPLVDLTSFSPMLSGLWLTLMIIYAKEEERQPFELGFQLGQPTSTKFIRTMGWNGPLFRAILNQDGFLPEDTVMRPRPTRGTTWARPTPTCMTQPKLKLFGMAFGQNFEAHLEFRLGFCLSFGKPIRFGKLTHICTIHCT